jgi:hypothetical protein
MPKIELLTEINAPVQKGFDLARRTGSGIF